MNATRNVTLVTVLAVVCGLFAASGCGMSDTGRKYPVYRVNSAPVIDGAMDGDSAWTTIPFEDAFVTPFVQRLGTHLPAYKQTSFKIGYDDANLYVAVKSREPWTRYLDKNGSSGQPFQKDDGVELLFASQDSETVYHFVINATGPRWSGNEGGRRTSTADWSAETTVNNDVYVVEARIPFVLLGGTPKRGDVWKANVVRNTVTVISPEDRQTSWSPVQTDFDDPHDFGRFEFQGSMLTEDEAQDIESKLAEASNKFLQLEEESLAWEEEREDVLAESYRQKVEQQKAGFTGITKGPADLVVPPGQPKDEVWRYGLGFPMQIGPTQAALLTNIRMEGSGNIDFEIGTDVIVFDDLAEITVEHAIPVSRYERKSDPENGEIIVRKGPIIGGFVPYGARLEDSSPHPAAGTGFGICWAISHKVDENGKFDYTDYIERYAMLYQFTFDGERFHVVEEKRIDAGSLLPNWNLVGNFVTNAIPDGQDLLYVMIARVDDHSVAGFTRWQYGAFGWHPVSFTPVTAANETWSEPSLIRDNRRSLLFSARSYDRAFPVVAFDIAVWQSVDNGLTWSQVIYEKNRRARSPVSINRTVDGTPFIAANTPPLRRTREVLSIWPLDDSRTKLEGRITARDARSEFGPAPSGSWWRIDHPTSAVVRLRDHMWHSVLAYRIVDNGEVEGDAPPAAQTGCYVEEVLSAGEPVPIWKFE